MIVSRQHSLRIYPHVHMIQRLQTLRQAYPSQFWLIFVGLMISTLGASMIWPFLMIYVSEKLDLPLSVAASLITLNAAMGLIFSFIAGPITDRAGRKWVMAISLALNGLVYILLGKANSLPVFALGLAASGAVNPIYRIAADAMMADLIPAEKRPDAYALLRTSNNLGVALGPAIGGMIAATSYSLAFFLAAAGMLVYSLLVALRFKETLPSQPAAPHREPLGGYARVFKDRPFVGFAVAFMLAQIPAAMLWVLLSVYTKQNYGLPENLYGLLPMTNALMVVFFQVGVTRVTKRFAALPVLAVGSIFYAFGTGSVAWMSGFLGFWLCMVIATIGELIQSPTATTYAANRAPADMRGRYMSIYGLTWGVAAGIGPLLGGWLNDNISPQAIWYGAMSIAFVSMACFLWLAHQARLAQAAARAEGEALAD